MTPNRSSSKHAGEEPGNVYTEGAALDRQARVTDFVPQRRLWLVAMGLLGASLVGMVCAAHYLQLQAIESGAWSATHLAALACLELGAPGGIGGWLTATMLLASAAVCLVVFVLRRHRRDDYRGRYRVWLSTAVLASVASICSAAPLHQSTAAIAVHATGWQASESGFEWWLAPVALLLGVQAVRLVLEVRRTRMALTLLLAATASFALSLLAMPFGPLAAESGSTLAGATQLVAALCFLMTTLTYCRYVVLEIEGLVQPKPVKNNQIAERTPAPRSAAEANGRKTQSSDTAQRVAESAAVAHSGGDRPAGTPTSQQRRQTKAALRVAAEYEEEDDDQSVTARRQAKNRTRMPNKPQKPQAYSPDDQEMDDDDDQLDNSGNRKLSKGERKRLRKFKAQQRDAA